MATHAPTIAALNFYRAATDYQSAIAPRLFVSTDEDVDMCEANIAPAFEALIASPAPSLEAVAVKAAAILGEFEGGDVPADLVRSIYHDLSRLMAS